MASDKIRIRKSIQPKVDKWCDCLEISQSEFVHEALTHYIRFLQGKPTGSNVVTMFPTEPNIEPVAELDVDDFDGGIAL